MNTIYLFPLSMVGFCVSFYIYRSKKHKTHLYCPVGGNCDAVVRSKYGKTFGVENTIPGMLYFLLVFFYAAAAFFDQNIFKGNLVYYLIVSASVCSVAFSVYLTAVQAFVLKKWCDYCIISSISSLLISIVLIF